MALDFVKYIFVSLFLGVLFLGLICVSAIIVHFITQVIKMFKPDFMELKRPETEKEKSDSQESVRLLAIDYLIRERIRKQKELFQAQQRLLHPEIHPEPPSLQVQMQTAGAAAEDEIELVEPTEENELKITTPEMEQEWEVSEMVAKQIQPPIVFPTAHAHDDLAVKAAWCLARFPRGLAHPQFLCATRLIKGREPKMLFAPLRSRRLTFSLDHAREMAENFAGCMILPASAAARVMLRLERKRRELNINSEEASVCEGITSMDVVNEAR